MRKALLIGIDAYKNTPLAGCVDDVEKMAEILSRHADNSPNFECRKLTSDDTAVNQDTVLQALKELYHGDSEAAFFYFAGHGTINNLGGYLVTQDAQKYAAGVAMSDVIQLANESKARERLIMIDCCHSGALGSIPAISNSGAFLQEGVSVLTASRDTEKALEKTGGGVFTTLIHAGLDGGAADVCGKVTVASLYAYVDEVLGAWDQRPLFKAHVSKLISLRNCKPSVPLEVLRLLPQYFKTPESEFKLDSSYEPTAEPRNHEHEKIFFDLQRYRAARLVEPVGADHMYDAAMKGKSCALTPLGFFYWHRAASGKI